MSRCTSSGVDALRIFRIRPSIAGSARRVDSSSRALEPGQLPSKRAASSATFTLAGEVLVA
jgi:hypothetical protein